MTADICPICGGTSCSSTDELGGYKHLCCSTYDLQFSAGEEIDELPDEEQKYRIYNLIFEKVLRTPFKSVGGRNKEWFFFYDEDDKTQDGNEPNKINIAKEMGNYPSNVAEKVNRALLNLSIKYRNVGDIINWSHGSEFRLLFCDTKNQVKEAHSIKNFMRGLEYLDGDPGSGTGTISYKGWAKIDELNTNKVEINQGFIAISFSPDAEPIMEVFKDAIDEAGYIPMVISEKEHNNQIVPEIFYEIKRSKFVVVDVTYPNYGAYYEAGYGQALKKQIIVCCRKDEFDNPDSKPHFDIVQKATIIWNTKEELKENLIRRIQATVDHT